MNPWIIFALLSAIFAALVAIFSILFLDDKLTLKTGLGAVLITTGAFLITLK